MIDSLKRIREAEEKAKAKIEAAEKKAADIVKQAEARAVEQVEQRSKASMTEAAEIRTKQRETAEAEASHILTSFQEESKPLEKKAQSRVEGAAKSVMHHIIGDI